MPALRQCQILKAGWHIGNAAGSSNAGRRHHHPQSHLTPVNLFCPGCHTVGIVSLQPAC